MSILDLMPKESVRTLIGREDELRKFISAVVKHRIVVLLGPRRIGKTSILRTAARILSGKEEIKNLTLKKNYVPIYVNMWEVTGYRRSIGLFFHVLTEKIGEALRKTSPDLARKYEEKVYGSTEEREKEVSGGISAGLALGTRTKTSKTLQRLATTYRAVEALDSVIAQHGGTAVLMIDEAQELGTLKPGFSTGTWLAHIHDDLGNIKVVLSGSYVGILKRILEPKRTDPLFDRDILKLEVGKLPPNAMVELLVKSMAEKGIKPSETFMESLRKILNDLRLLPPDFLKLPITTGDTGMQLALLLMLDSVKIGNTKNITVEVEKFKAAVIYMAINAFLNNLTQEIIQGIGILADLPKKKGGKALTSLAALIFSGTPGVIIKLVRELSDEFDEDEVFTVGAKVLREGAKAVCDEVNHFITNYSRKPEVFARILYMLAKRPTRFTDIVKTVGDIVTKKTVAEDLKTMQRLGYISKITLDNGRTIYYVSDPLLLYALNEECIGII